MWSKTTGSHHTIQITNTYNIVITIQRELSGGHKYSGRAPSDRGSRHSSAASLSTAHCIDSGSHMSAKDRTVSADSGE